MSDAVILALIASLQAIILAYIAYLMRRNGSKAK